MNHNIDPTKFRKRYTLISSTKDWCTDLVEYKICRYCKKIEPETTFRNIPHVIPELFGENDITGNDECDKCNSQFSKLESHVAIFFRPYLTMVGVKGKKKVPEFQSRTSDGKANSQTTVKHISDTKREMWIGKNDDYVIDKDKNTMSVTFRLPPYKPLYVYAALVKIALSLLPVTKLNDYQHVFDWLNGKGNKIPLLPYGYVTMLTKKKFAQPFAELYETYIPFEDGEFSPEITLVLYFGNIVFQIFLPIKQEFEKYASNGGLSTPVLFPAYLLNIDFDEIKTVDDINFKYNIVDLSSINSVKQDKILNFRFESGEYFSGIDSD